MRCWPGWEPGAGPLALLGGNDFADAVAIYNLFRSTSFALMQITLLVGDI